MFDLTGKHLYLKHFSAFRRKAPKLRLAPEIVKLHVSPSAMIVRTSYRNAEYFLSIVLLDFNWGSKGLFIRRQDIAKARISECLLALKPILSCEPAMLPSKKW